MRVTQSMLAGNSLRNISASYDRMGKMQDQLSTGKKITRASDDPVVAMKGMFYRSGLTEVEQYKRNLSELNLWMENSEAGLDQANSVLQRVRELVVQGKNGTLSPSDMNSIAREVEQLKQDLVKTANTQVAGKYIFHGSDVDHPPMKETDPPALADNLMEKNPDGTLNALYNPTLDNYKVEVSRGVSFKANINPYTVFSKELFDVVQGIQTSLEEGKPEQLDGLLGKLDKTMDNLSGERSELGARTNRLDMVSSRIDQQEVMATRVLSDNEDADIERVITDLKTQESVHRAALSVGARIIQPSLMDFLR